MNANQAKALQDPFPAEAIGKLPKGGIELDFVGHAAVTKRLLAVDPEWTWEPLALSEHGLPVFDNAGGMWIKLTICGVTRLGYGDGKNPKEVIGDAIRNAAMRFGVALDLWAREDLSSISADPLLGAEAGESTVAEEGIEPPSSEPSDAQAARDAASPATRSAVAGLAAAATAEPSSGAVPAQDTTSDPKSASRMGKARVDEEGAGPDDVSNSEGIGGTSEGSAYLTKEEQRVFAKAFGGQLKAVQAARERLGDRIRGLSDLTRDMARELIATKGEAA